MAKSITTFGAVLAAMVVAMSAALAAPETIDASHSIYVKPGKWEWSHKTMIGMMPIEQANIACVMPENTSMSLQEITDSLSSDCNIADVKKDNDLYYFKLACEGQASGKAAGQLIVSETNFDLTGHGIANLSDVSSSFTITANARYLGECD